MMHPGTQRYRRTLRAMSRYYRRRDPWDLMPRDVQLDISTEDRGAIRAREHEYILHEVENAFDGEEV